MIIVIPLKDISKKKTMITNYFIDYWLQKTTHFLILKIYIYPHVAADGFIHRHIAVDVAFYAFYYFSFY